VSWDQDPKVFIGKALSPSEVVAVELLPSEMTAIVVVPDRQLSLAIGKEGQNTRLAARLTGWRLDIKGMTEWEEIRETRRIQLAEQATAETEEMEEEEAAVAVLETTEVEVEEAAVATVETVEESPVEAEAIAEPAVQAADEEEILEALIREEEGQEAQEAVAAGAEASPSFSVDDLDSFTLVDVGPIEDDDEAEEDGEEEFVLVPDAPPAMAIVTPDAGKIRFAEDLMEDARGGGRRNNRARRGGAARRGPPGPANRTGGGR
jgi:N utilization substance protein A